jgi:hypothetical protein
MTYHRIGRIATLSLAIAAIAAPTASAGPDHTPLRGHAPTTAAADRHVRETQDFVSPDARDVADGRGAWNSPQVTIVRVPQPMPSAGGLDWGDAGIGAGAGAGLMLIALGTGLALMQRRHGGRTPTRPAKAA